MGRRASTFLAAAVLGTACVASAHGPQVHETPGALVGLAVEVEGREAPLYPARDGSGRYYFEAREGARYALRLVNRSGERVAALLLVDGINVISGQREVLPSPGARPGRMYVLSPWDSTLVQGWRTSLHDVRRFTFVDERASYAARTGQASGRLGWVQLAVYRERRPFLRHDRDLGTPAPRPWEEADEDRPSAQKAAPSAEAERRRDQAGAAAPRSSYPGTGWGQRTEDHATVVSFEPEGAPSQTQALRYEYRSALLSLGVLPRPDERARLRQRERGEDGFAKPPRW